jgi:predicted  nucleic acid-binding Zn-ribbon protein
MLVRENKELKIANGNLTKQVRLLEQEIQNLKAKLKEYEMNIRNLTQENQSLKSTVE